MVYALLSVAMHTLFIPPTVHGDRVRWHIPPGLSDMCTEPTVWAAKAASRRCVGTLASVQLC